MQGTGAVVTAGFINGMKLQRTELRDARIVFYGAGSSAVGVANSIVMHMVQVWMRGGEGGRVGGCGRAWCACSGGGGCENRRPSAL